MGLCAYTVPLLSWEEDFAQSIVVMCGLCELITFTPLVLVLEL